MVEFLNVKLGDINLQSKGKVHFSTGTVQTVRSIGGVEV